MQLDFFFNNVQTWLKKGLNMFLVP